MAAQVRRLGASAWVSLTYIKPTAEYKNRLDDYNAQDRLGLFCDWLDWSVMSGSASATTRRLYDSLREEVQTFESFCLESVALESIFETSDPELVKSRLDGRFRAFTDVERAFGELYARFLRGEEAAYGTSVKRENRSDPGFERPRTRSTPRREPSEPVGTDSASRKVENNGPAREQSPAPFPNPEPERAEAPGAGLPDFDEETSIPLAGIHARKPSPAVRPKLDLVKRPRPAQRVVAEFPSTPDAQVERQPRSAAKYAAPTLSRGCGERSRRVN